MRKTFIFLLSSAFIFVANIFAEDITITTYYPAPYGVYNTFRLYPRTASGPCQEGELYYDSTARGPYYCDRNLAWQSFGGGYWRLDKTPTPDTLLIDSLTVPDASTRVQIGNWEGINPPTKARLEILEDNIATTTTVAIRYEGCSAGGPRPDITGLELEWSDCAGRNGTGILNRLSNNYNRTPDNYIISGMVNAWDNSVSETYYGFRNYAPAEALILAGEPGGRFYGLANTFNSGQVSGSDAQLYGVYNDIPNGNNNGGTATVYGVYSRGTTSEGGTDIFYGHYVESNVSSTGGSQYAYYADLSVGTATKWGLYLNGENTNYISGSLGIGTNSSVTKFAVSGLTGNGAYPFVRVNTATGDFYYDISASSKRYKKDIKPLRDNFSKILKLQPKSFKYKTEDVKDIGYIAEELDEQGLKNLVTYNKDGNPEGIKYEKISIYLLEVIKQQQKDIEELKVKLQTVKQSSAHR